VSAFLSKVFDVGDSPVLTFGNCVLKPGVIKWPVKLYVRFFTFFKIQKTRLSTFFLSRYTRFLEHCATQHSLLNASTERKHCTKSSIQLGDTSYCLYVQNIKYESTTKIAV